MKQIIENFYDAFTKLDSDTMASCYHKDVVFEDPAFGKLTGNRAKAMWSMLCKSQKDKGFKVIVSNIKATKDSGSAKWEAFYTFSKTGKKVHNIISANFEFKDGLIISHKDNFNLRNWAKQAMGLKGLLLGGTNFFKLKLQKQTHQLLDNYIKKHGI